MASLTSAVCMCYSLEKSGNDATWCQLFWLVCILICVTNIAEIRLHSSTDRDSLANGEVGEWGHE